MTFDLERLARTLAAPGRAPTRLSVPGFAAAAVLAPLVLRGGRPHLVFTQRPAALRQHPGQISFPGGKRDPADPSAGACAVRETAEELGIDPAAIELLGELGDVATPTGYVITPVVARLAAPVAYRPNPDEVEEAFEVALAELAVPDAHHDRGVVRAGDLDYPMHEYHVGGRIIWGATGRIVRELLAVWRS